MKFWLRVLGGKERQVATGTMAYARFFGVAAIIFSIPLTATFAITNAWGRESFEDKLIRIQNEYRQN